MHSRPHLEFVHREDQDGLQLQETAYVRHKSDLEDPECSWFRANLLLYHVYLAILKLAGLQECCARDQRQLSLSAAAAPFL